MTQYKKHVKSIDLIDKEYDGMTLERFIQALSEIEIPEGQEAIIDVKEDYDGYIQIDFFEQITAEEEIKAAKEKAIYEEVFKLSALLAKTHSTISWKVAPKKSMYKEVLEQLYAASEEVSSVLLDMHSINVKEQIEYFENLDRVISERERLIAKLEEIMKNDE